MQGLQEWLEGLVQDAFKNKSLDVTKQKRESPEATYAYIIIIIF